MFKMAFLHKVRSFLGIDPSSSKAGVKNLPTNENDNEIYRFNKETPSITTSTCQREASVFMPCWYEASCWLRGPVLRPQNTLLVPNHVPWITSVSAPNRWRSDLAPMISNMCPPSPAMSIYQREARAFMPCGYKAFFCSHGPVITSTNTSTMVSKLLPQITSFSAPNRWRSNFAPLIPNLPICTRPRLEANESMKAVLVLFAEKLTVKYQSMAEDKRLKTCKREAEVEECRKEEQDHQEVMNGQPSMRLKVTENIKSGEADSSADPTSYHNLSSCKRSQLGQRIFQNGVPPLKTFLPWVKSRSGLLVLAFYSMSHKLSWRKPGHRSFQMCSQMKMALQKMCLHLWKTGSRSLVLADSSVSNIQKGEITRAQELPENVPEENVTSFLAEDREAIAFTGQLFCEMPPANPVHFKDFPSSRRDVDQLKKEVLYVQEQMNKK